ncbi:hypothetical protein QTP81_16945 [Alteromonas sp. ASW11-36]|uniref:Uncharacterized protein n=1 Tax=Alteromonas arenosi TaxID=3055817 RepID=A0ABT7T1I1_9ALTE|nr:hypothetical protein [Alteromonas sp. ASW11-36]MDM7862297.1 hypothetical protein [Alteromonas sp. ASW11-36]
MNKKVTVNLLLLLFGLIICYWMISIFDPEKDYGRRHPLFIFVLGLFLACWAVKDLLLIAINPVLKRNYPKLYVRLNSDFWTFLLGPVKDKK